MALPTGTLRYPTAGVLRVFLSARWSATTSDFGSPDFTTGNLRIRAYVGPSDDYTYTGVVNKFTQAAYIDVNYPGGNVTWDVGAEQVDSSAPDLLVTIALRDIRVSWELIKK